MVGYVTGKLLRVAHVRNNAVTILVATLVALVALYASWVVWVYAVLQQVARNDSAVVAPSILELVQGPRLLADIILRINEVGLWSMGNSSHAASHPVKGIELAVFWLGEAVCIVALAIMCAVHLASSTPYCERCNRWCTVTPAFLTTAPGDPAELKQRLEAKDLTWLRQLPAAGTVSWWAFDLHRCQGCSALHVLSARLVTVTVDRKGRTQKKSKNLLDKLMLTAEEAAVVVAPRPAAHAWYNPISTMNLPRR